MAAPSIGQLGRSCVQNALNKQLKMNKLINNEVHGTDGAAAPAFRMQLQIWLFCCLKTHLHNTMEKGEHID